MSRGGRLPVCLEYEPGGKMATSSLAGALLALLRETRGGGDAQPFVERACAQARTAAGADFAAVLARTTGGGYAWLVQPTGEPKATRGPLDWQGVQITGIGPASSIDLTTLRVTDPAFSGVATVKAGKLADVPIPPAAAKPAQVGSLSR